MNNMHLSEALAIAGVMFIGGFFAVLAFLNATGGL
jgi:hypothetical protein